MSRINKAMNRTPEETDIVKFLKEEGFKQETNGDLDYMITKQVTKNGTFEIGIVYEYGDTLEVFQDFEVGGRVATVMKKFDVGDWSTFDSVYDEALETLKGWAK